MSVSAAHAAAFRREVPQEGRVWTIRDSGGFPAPMNPDGKRAMPFWSKKSRAQRVVDRVPAYNGFQIVEIELADWLERWLPGLDRDGHLVGINWSGTDAAGYDIEPKRVAAWFTSAA